MLSWFAFKKSLKTEKDLFRPLPEVPTDPVVVSGLKANVCKSFLLGSSEVSAIRYAEAMWVVAWGRYRNAKRTERSPCCLAEQGAS